MKTIGLDIGTTSISAVVYNSDTDEVLASRNAPNDGFLPSSNAWERIQNADELANKAEEMLSEFLAEHPDISAVGITGQMHGIVYTDGNGKAVSPLYTWQDGRGDLPYKDGESIVSYLSKVSGQRLATGYGLVTYFCLSRSGQVPEDAVSLCTIGDYVGMRLCGRKTPLLHSSNAASIGLFDLNRFAFMRDIFPVFGMGVGILPSVTQHFEFLGTYRGIPVTTAIGDNQASFLGTAGFSTDAVLVNVGTGGQISVASKMPFVSDNTETRPLLDDKFLLVGSSLCGGRAYAVLEKFFRSYVREAYGRDESQYQVMERLAEEGAGCAEQPGMQVETAFMGTRSDPSRRGSISGISEDNFTPAGLVYGTLSGIADELFNMWLEIRDGAGIKPSALYGAGNAIRRNRVLRRIFEEMFGMKMKVLPRTEEAACGAAKAAMKAVSGT